MLYLADRYDQERKISYAPGTPEYVEQLSWLMFQMGGLGPMMGMSIVFLCPYSSRLRLFCFPQSVH
jgi:glutathione S-transferase